MGGCAAVRRWDGKMSREGAKLGAVRGVVLERTFA